MNQHCIDAYQFHTWNYRMSKQRADRFRKDLNEREREGLSDRKRREYQYHIALYSSEATYHYLQKIPLRNYRPEWWEHYRGCYEQI